MYSLQYPNTGQGLLTTPLRDIVNFTRQSQIPEQFATPIRDLKVDPIPNRSKADAVLSTLCCCEIQCRRNRIDVFLLLKLRTQLRYPKVCPKAYPNDRQRRRERQLPRPTLSRGVHLNFFSSMPTDLFFDKLNLRPPCSREEGKDGI
jgi:hypothetical protein